MPTKRKGGVQPEHLRKRKVVTFRTDPAIVASIEEHAAARGLSKAAYVDRIVQEALEREVATTR